MSYLCHASLEHSVIIYLIQEELEELIEEATLDCYGEYEQINGFAYTLEDKLTFPFYAKVVGEEVEVIGIECEGMKLLQYVNEKVKNIPLISWILEIDSDKVKGYKWIEAYHIWRRGQ